MSLNKAARKIAKHLVFMLLSFVLVHAFFLYFIPYARLWEMMSTPPGQHSTTFFLISLAWLAFYGVYARFREQVCTLVCPYGRLQGVMLDEESILVSYDHKRGEPRGKGSRQKHQELGDCIDCDQCVLVCPTGIDIRNGTQLECTNCTACIDACNRVMDQVNLPQGLIRYDSYKGIVQGKRRIMTPRTLGYSLVLGLLTVLLVFFIGTRSQVETSVLRTPGVLYQTTQTGYTNLYNYKVINKSYDPVPFYFKLIAPQGARLKMVGSNDRVVSGGRTQGAFFIEIDKAKLTQTKVKVRLQVFSEDRMLEEVSTIFIGPFKRQQP